MNVIGITSCTVGIAHTYMAREKLLAAGSKMGVNVKIETQGSGGVEFHLTDEDIKNADVVIIASDVVVSGKDRFKGIPMVEVPVSVALKTPESLLTKVQTMLNSRKKED